MPTCTQLGCQACCDFDRNGNAFCQVTSMCKGDPLWQSIVIPAVIFLLAVILLLIAICKLRTQHTETMKVHNFARQQIRIDPKFSEGRLLTATSLV